MFSMKRINRYVFPVRKQRGFNKNDPGKTMIQERAVTDRLKVSGSTTVQDWEGKDKKVMQVKGRQ